LYLHNYYLDSIAQRFDGKLGSFCQSVLVEREAL